MKKYFIIYIIILLLSCESLGVNEYTDELSYYEYVGFGWTHFFDKNYSTALDYFQTAIDINQVEHVNSANVGKAWTYLMLANMYVGSSSMSTSRYISDSLFKESKIQDTEASLLYSECDYTFCCNDCFINDYKVGIIYGDVYRYLNNEQDALTYIVLTEKITEFINEHSDSDTIYDFMDGKPNTGNFNLNTNSLIFLLAQLHFSNQNIYDSCLLLNQNNLCSNIADFNTVLCDQNNMSYESIELLLSCLESYTPLN